jgi:hypothetical protein
MLCNPLFSLDSFLWSTVYGGGPSLRTPYVIPSYVHHASGVADHPSKGAARSMGARWGG